MNNLLDILPHKWNLIIAPNRYRLLMAAAELAKHTPLIVLDCGRQFDSTIVARAAHGRPEVIDRIQVQRAFICYEALKLLERTPTGKTPILILDYLSTFYDENVKMHTRKFLLESSLRHFQRLSQGGGLAVTIHPPSSHDDFYLYQRLSSAASQVLTYEIPEVKTQQLSLF